MKLGNVSFGFLPLAAAVLWAPAALAQQSYECALSFGQIASNARQDAVLRADVNGTSLYGELVRQGSALIVRGDWSASQVRFMINGQRYEAFVHLTAEDGTEVRRLAGRYGDDWQGVWFGDCRPRNLDTAAEIDDAGRSLASRGDIALARGAYLDLETGMAGSATDAADIIHTAGISPALAPVLSARFIRVARGQDPDRVFDPLYIDRCLSAVEDASQDAIPVAFLAEGDLFCASTGNNRISSFIVTETPRAAGMPVGLRYVTWQE